MGSRETSLFLQKELVLYSFTAKHAAHPGHPSYCTVYLPTVYYRFEMNARAPEPVGTCVQRLLGSLDIFMGCSSETY
jgi:hypothetical protein